MNGDEFEELMLAVSAYRDCIKFRQRDEDICWNCPITGSGLPIPNDICNLTDEERETRIDESLDKIWKAYHNKEILVREEQS